MKCARFSPFNLLFCSDAAPLGYWTVCIDNKLSNTKCVCICMRVRDAREPNYKWPKMVYSKLIAISLAKFKSINVNNNKINDDQWVDVCVCLFPFEMQNSSKYQFDPDCKIYWRTWNEIFPFWMYSIKHRIWWRNPRQPIISKMYILQ